MRRRLNLIVLLLATAACDSVVPDVAITEYRLGQEYTFNVRLSEGMLCSGDTDVRTGRVVASSDRVVLLSDLANPAGGYSELDYQTLALRFDAHTWPLITHNFGRPHDIDRNERVVIFFTRAVNELTSSGGSQYVGGVFAARDLFPRAKSGRLGGCAGSNEAEMIYMIVPDPNGDINGNVRTRTSELERAPKVLVHEMQHLINASRRLYDGGSVPANWNEALWLNEGLSHIAEELSGYAASGFAPRSNIDPEHIANAPGTHEVLSVYQYPNFQNVGRFLANPHMNSPIGPDALATRGATWQFLRYVADRNGTAEDVFWRSLIRPGRVGLDNLATSLGTDPLEWMQDWLVAIYADDFTSGAHSRYRQPSWNFREILPVMRSPSGMPYGLYPLRTHALADASPLSLDIASGGGAYIEFGIASNSRAEIRVNGGGSTCRTNGPSRSLNVGEVVHLPDMEAGAFCVDASADDAAFVLVPFNGSGASIQLTISGDGLGSAMASKSDRPMATEDDALAPHPTWETAFREHELQELSRLVPGAPVSSNEFRAQSVMATAPNLRMVVLRTQ